ncbi:MAG: hydroxyacylglutathione hydrolase [Cyanobacteria bacterium P01_H01_bin.15]
MDILQIPVLRDNYTFVLHDPQTNQAIVIDPGEAKPVANCIEYIEADLVAIWHTHHHWDHIGGNQQLLSQFPALAVYGSQVDRERLPGQQHYLSEGDILIFANRKAQVLYIPGHTQGHIAYYFPPVASDSAGDLFCGDTLFAGGCGRLLGGTAEQLWRSLTRLSQLPEQTRIWCAHEYTQNNLAFALTVEPHNEQLQKRYREVVNLRRADLATIPTYLGLEKDTNPFLRCESPEIQSRMKTEDPLKVFTRLRKAKDRF